MVNCCPSSSYLSIQPFRLLWKGLYVYRRCPDGFQNDGGEHFALFILRHHKVLETFEANCQLWLKINETEQLYLIPLTDTRVSAFSKTTFLNYFFPSLFFSHLTTMTSSLALKMENNSRGHLRIFFMQFPASSVWILFIPHRMNYQDRLLTETWNWGISEEGDLLLFSATVGVFGKAHIQCVQIIFQKNNLGFFWDKPTLPSFKACLYWNRD